MDKEVILEIAKKAGIEHRNQPNECEKIILFAELLKKRIFEELQKHLRIK